MAPDDLRRDLDQLLAASDRTHIERLTIATAIISEALRARGLEATLVGGGALEFYDPGSYTTTDIDLVVERKRPVDLERALADSMESLGFSRKGGRHWIRADLFVEVPSTAITDPTETFAVGSYTLRVIRKEIILGERIVGFKHWHYTGFGAQAIDMIVAFGDELDEALLAEYLCREDAQDAYESLRHLARSEEPITQEVLETELSRFGRGSLPGKNDAD